MFQKISYEINFWGVKISIENGIMMELFFFVIAVTSKLIRFLLEILIRKLTRLKGLFSLTSFSSWYSVDAMESRVPTFYLKEGIFFQQRYDEIV